MKIKLYLLVLMLISILTIGIVKAEEGPFLLDWEVEYSYNGLHETKYKDGYIFVEKTSSNQIISIYDKNGTKTASKTIEGNRVEIISILVNNDDIYVLYNDINNGTHNYIVKFNNKLEGTPVETSNISLFDYLDIQKLHLKDNILYVLQQHPFRTYKFSSDYTTLEQVSITVKDFFPDAYFEEEMRTRAEEAYRNSISHTSYYKNKVLASLSVPNDDYCHMVFSPSPNSQIAFVSEHGDCYDSQVTLYDDSLNEIWKKDLGRAIVRSVELIDNYALVSCYDKNKSYIYIYDMSGNLIQTISSENDLYDTLRRGELGFAVNDPCYISIVSSPDVMPAPTTCPNKHQVYVLGHLIKTKVEGKGKINVKSYAKSGAPVTFKVEPEDGYILSVVNVKDATGKTVALTDYTFTMPSADVEVEAVFVASKNPNTNTGFIYSLIFLIFCSAFAVIITNYNRVQER